MTFRQSRDAAESNSAASAGLTSTGEREAPILIDDEAEEVPRIAAEDTHGPSLTKGEDPVRLYLKEIGKVSLLTAAQEVQIGRRIEVGQIALRRTVAVGSLSQGHGHGDHCRASGEPEDRRRDAAEARADRRPGRAGTAPLGTDQRARPRQPPRADPDRCARAAYAREVCGPPA